MSGSRPIQVAPRAAPPSSGISRQLSSTYAQAPRILEIYEQVLRPHKSGLLHLSVNTGKDYKLRWCQLKHGRLSIFEHPPLDGEESYPPGTEPLYKIRLEDSTLSTMERSGTASPVSSSLLVMRVDGQRLYLRASSDEEMKAWKFAFQSAIAFLIDKLSKASHAKSSYASSPYGVAPQRSYSPDGMLSARPLSLSITADTEPPRLPDRSPTISRGSRTPSESPTSRSSDAAGSKPITVTTVPLVRTGSQFWLPREEHHNHDDGSVGPVPRISAVPLLPARRVASEPLSAADLLHAELSPEGPRPAAPTQVPICSSMPVGYASNFSMQYRSGFSAAIGDGASSTRSSASTVSTLVSPPPASVKDLRHYDVNHVPFQHVGAGSHPSRQFFSHPALEPCGEETGDDSGPTTPDTATVAVSRVEDESFGLFGQCFSPQQKSRFAMAASMPQPDDAFSSSDEGDDSTESDTDTDSSDSDSSRSTDGDGSQSDSESGSEGGSDDDDSSDSSQLQRATTPELPHPVKKSPLLTQVVGFSAMITVTQLTSPASSEACTPSASEASQQQQQQQTVTVIGITATAVVAPPPAPTSRYIPPHLRSAAGTSSAPASANSTPLSQDGVASAPAVPPAAPAAWRPKRNYTAQCCPPSPPLPSPEYHSECRRRFKCESAGSKVHGMFVTQGLRSRLEDRHVLIDDIASHLNAKAPSDAPVTPSASENIATPRSRHSFYALFDGHGGVHTATMAASKLPGLVFAHESFGLDPCRAISCALEQFDKDYIAEANTMLDSSEWSSGCTALVAVRRGSSISVGYLGDSRAVLCRSGKAVDLSRDHTPDSDLVRIQSAGGWVTTERELQLRRLKDMDLKDPVVHRLAQEAVKWNVVSRVNGELGVARALGDANYKLGARMDAYDWPFPGAIPRVFSSDIVSGVPDVNQIDVIDGDEFLILACDGLWEVLTSQSVIELTKQYLAEGSSPEVAAEKLVDVAIKLGSEDNVTAIIVLL